MFSLLLKGRLGEWLAPRPPAAEELYALIKVKSILNIAVWKIVLGKRLYVWKAGLYDKAMTLFRETGSKAVMLDSLEMKSGLGLIHLVSACGALVRRCLELHSSYIDIVYVIGLIGWIINKWSLCRFEICW